VSRPRREADLSAEATLRIIGGSLRGRKLRYHGDPVTRPMKDRVREAIFNLIGAEVAGREAVDLFGGTGALGIEALSRGAESALLIERHVPTSRVIAENLQAVGVEGRATLLTTSAFLWGRRDLPRLRPEAVAAPPGATPQGESAVPSLARPWIVFCSPPYAFYREHWSDLETLLGELTRVAPAESMVVVEADEQFDFGLLEAVSGPPAWRVRSYPPAVIGVWRKHDESSGEASS
jgi:16S rRNA G966 N2-methylase RsmD